MRKKLLVRMGVALALAAGTALAQAPAATPAFEVASIKPAPPLDIAKMRSGAAHVGVTIDKARVDIGSLSLADLIRIAYKLKSFQLVGPDWMGSTRFDVMAKIPEGGTKEQVPEMLQALLAERFGLKTHRDGKEHSVYALVVAKNGPKMKPSEPDAVVAPPPEAAAGDPAEGASPPPPPGTGGQVMGKGENQVRVKQNPDGKGMTVAGQFGQMKMSMGQGGMMRLEFSKMPMAGLAEMLSRFADHPVVDMTELKGNYQVALELSLDEMRAVGQASAAAAGIMVPTQPGGRDAGKAPGDAASTPSSTSIFTAMQQLGLKLESRKAPLDILVVDHLEKMPTEN